MSRAESVVVQNVCVGAQEEGQMHETVVCVPQRIACE